MDKIYCGLGGGAGNTVATFSRLGLKTSVVARIGQDNFGEQIRRTLAKSKINTRYLQVDRGQQSGFSFIIISTRSKDHTVFVHRGANLRLQVKPAQLQTMQTKFYYLTSWPQESWQKDFKILLANKKKAKIFWNPGSEQLKLGWKKLARFFKDIEILNLNKDEAIELVISHPSCKKHSRSFLNQPKNLLKILSILGPDIIVITDGKNGAYASYQNKIYYEKALRVKVVDTTGAGDAFGSGLVAGLLLFNNDLQRALRLGIKNSAAVIQKIGAQTGLFKKLIIKNS
jgi:ribokinase